MPTILEQIAEVQGDELRVLVVTPNTLHRDNLLYETARQYMTVGILTPRLPARREAARLDYQGDFIGLTRSLRWYSRLDDTIRSFRPHLIHLHGEAWSLTAQRLSRGSIPLVVHGAENVISTAPSAVKLRRLGLSRVLARLDGYVSWGHTGLQAIEEAGLPKSTPRDVIPGSPPDPNVFSPAKPRSGDESFRLIFVGRLESEKGVETILRAMAQSQVASLSLDVVGSGSLRDRLQRQASVARLNVRFWGMLSDVEVHALLSQSDLLIAPSIDSSTGREQWGRSVVEAMFTGIGVLVSDGGELPLLVSDTDCVFPQNDERNLAAKIQRLAADRSLLRSKAQQMFKRSKRFEPALLARRLTNFWQTVMNT